jgi:hypothetical protein
MNKSQRALTIIACLTISLIEFGCGEPPERRPSASFQQIKFKIKEGDINFDLSEYKQALIAYEKAEQWLSSMMDFEKSSPSVNIALLQRCYNTKAFLQARIELTKTTEEITCVDYQHPFILTCLDD